MLKIPEKQLKKKKEKKNRKRNWTTCVCVFFFFLSLGNLFNKELPEKFNRSMVAISWAEVV